MRFLADEMLVRLARLLRSAGYDTALAEGGTPDAQLLDIARAEGRVLLTQDRRLAQSAAPAAVLVEGAKAADQARRLGQALGLDWSHAPFTRCTIDNAELAPASPAQIAAMPPESQVLPGPFRACPACGRVYWPGSHVRRMSARLAELGDGD